MTSRKITTGEWEKESTSVVSEIVQLAGNYDSVIHIRAGIKNVNAKSIMGMMALRMGKGQDVEVIAEGSDEEEAVNGLSDFLVSKAV